MRLRSSGGEPKLEEVGEDPDLRFTLANERTFLAWVRTAIAVMVAGLAVAQFFESRSEATRLAIALPLLVLGAVVAFTSYSGWEERERAMRLAQPLPASALPRLLALSVGLIAVLATILTLTDR